MLVPGRSAEMMFAAGYVPRALSDCLGVRAWGLNFQGLGFRIWGFWFGLGLRFDAWTNAIGREQQQWGRRGLPFRVCPTLDF